MEVPLEITYRNVEKSDDVDQLIRDKAAKLDEMHDRITSCRVSVEKPQEHQKSGNSYRVRIDLRVPPGKELVVRREGSEGDMHDPLRTVITEAFKKIAKQLKKVKGKQQEGGKAQAGNPEEAGVVVRLFPEEGFGFIKTMSDREVYFHRNSLANGDFDSLEIGTGVRFIVKEGEKGPLASGVNILNTPGARAAEHA